MIQIDVFEIRAGNNHAFIFYTDRVAFMQSGIVAFNSKTLFSDPYFYDIAAAQKKTGKALALINKRFEISRYRRLAAAYPIDMPVWGALEKDLSKKPPKIVKRLDGKAPSTKRKNRIRSAGEAPSQKKKKTKT